MAVMLPPLRRITFIAAAAAAAALVALPTGLQAQASPPPGRAAAAPAGGLDSARTLLAKYADPVQALANGYLSTMLCIDFPTGLTEGEMQYPAGGMGVHLLNMGLVGQPLDLAKPQVLIYEPDGDKLKLVAAEWFVPVTPNQARPQLFGRPFDGPMEGHPPLMPATLHHWDLHVWLWKDNPAGTFVSTNPAVKCPTGAPFTAHGGAPKLLHQH